MIDQLTERLMKQEWYRNGRIISSEPTARNYSYLKSSLEKFTRSKYHRDFSKYHFRDITEKFLFDYALSEQIRGGKNGNRGGIHEKLKKLHAVCATAKRAGVYNMLAFFAARDKLKPRHVIPKALSHRIIQRIEDVDRAILDKKENLYLDLFLFSYYASGMSAIDVCLLTRDLIKSDMIIYDRMKCDKEARVLIIDKAAEIIERYRTEASMNYVFPVIKRRNPTQSKLYDRCHRVNEKVNQTLRKICETLYIKERVVWSSTRSSYISKLIDEGFHPLQVAEQVGNTPQTIYRYYYTINNKEAMKDKMNPIF